MEAASLWAGVRFTARNGSPEALLTDAAGQGLHLYGISAQPGGFCGHCAAWQYQRLAALARGGFPAVGRFPRATGDV